MARRERVRVCVAAAVATAWLPSLACSQAGLPPELGGCTADNDAGCSVASSGGGQSSGGADAAAEGSSRCQVPQSASQCDQCAYGSCCSQLSACFSSTACTNLHNCELGCRGVTACVTQCRSTYPTAVLALQQVDSCLLMKCLVCSESGIGDPCGPGNYSCVTGLACNGGYCTKPCAPTTACTGIGPNGGNYAGQQNACFALPSGEFCVPGCATINDCIYFPNTYCKATTSVSGAAVSVCVPLPDGG